MHDFTATGPPASEAAGSASAARKRASESSVQAGVCVFCHIPHNANPLAGLWNHRLPAVTYQLYESSTLKAQINQPTGSSRLCLSCHDGTLALGDLHVQSKGTQHALGSLRGAVSLGTDLSDDHPISFVYDTSLAGKNPELASPNTLPEQVQLDENGELQCTSCHDAHENKFDKFLVMDNRGAGLCVTCHQLRGWRESSHAVSPATRERAGTDPWPHTPFSSVADNGCANCHRQHAAGHPEWLLLEWSRSEACFTCHNGTVAAVDVLSAFRSLSVHPIGITEDLHAPDENPLFMTRHVACEDCHEPHSMRSMPRPPLGLPPEGSLGRMDVLGAIDGVDSSGGWVRQARTEYEVCYKCHGIAEQVDRVVSPTLLIRWDNVQNTRLELSPVNESFHPVETISRNPNLVPGLEAGYTSTSLLTCTHCHSTDGSDTGNAPLGPHGSVYEPILVREYQIVDPSPESSQTYDLCYRCHNRAALLSDRRGFPHRLHVVEEQAACAVCHDAHGSRNQKFLINFLRVGRTGKDVVEPVGSPPRGPTFESTGTDSGWCSLVCHDAPHDEERYPPETGTVGASAPYRAGARAAPRPRRRH